jgi:transaldolase
MTTPRLDNLKIKIFADGADMNSLRAFAADPLIKGFTTNPSLMRAAGVTDYKAYALEILGVVPDRPVSFEVFADDLPGMEAQAREIASWGSNVYVKIPVSNTKGEFTGPVVNALSREGIKLNITAIMTAQQVAAVAVALAAAPSLVSVFAGRVADTGRDPVPIMVESLQLLRNRPEAELLWASSREILNIFQADAIGCPVITVANEQLKKLSGIGRDLDALSLDAVRAFHRDAEAAGFSIPVGARTSQAAE